MAKYLYVQIQGIPQPVKIRADKLQLEGHEYLIKLGNQEVGVFKEHWSSDGGFRTKMSK